MYGFSRVGEFLNIHFANGWNVQFQIKEGETVKPTVWTKTPGSSVFNTMDMSPEQFAMFLVAVSNNDKVQDEVVNPGPKQD